LPERQQRLLRLVADGLSDAEIADRVEEPEQVVAHEIQGILAELGFRTRTHAIVYVLAREISATTRDHTPRAPVTYEVPDEDLDGGEPEGTEERPA
jgi:DNA-binding CsgD family transcriptional regulator